MVRVFGWDLLYRGVLKLLTEHCAQVVTVAKLHLTGQGQVHTRQPSYRHIVAWVNYGRWRVDAAALCMKKYGENYEKIILVVSYYQKNH